mmetsp:Transcript_15346/g.33160  ORF Transcript_15346/g.33160 Transcript_15346/m.33160 type:complete len:97 (+) Transcript_15346:216-506(+)
MLSQDHTSRIIATSSAALEAFSQHRHHIVENNDTNSSSSSTPRRRSSDAFHSSRHFEVTCQESYRLFKKCSQMRETEGFSCSEAVCEYMKCALNGC